MRFIFDGTLSIEFVPLSAICRDKCFRLSYGSKELGAVPLYIFEQELLSF